MILFVCHGNVARSQIAEAFLRELKESRVASAGTHVPLERDGKELFQDGDTARRISDYFKRCSGLDISRCQRTRLTLQLAEASSQIYVMTDKSDLPDFMGRFQEKVEYWNLSDPHDMSYKEFQKTVVEIKTRIEEIST